MSPTARLPNLVINGKSPHLPNRSTGKKKPDWLTLQLRKRAKCQDNLPKKVIVKAKQKYMPKQLV